jgi:hypothetical protein
VERWSEEFAVRSPFFACKNVDTVKVFHSDTLVHCL